MKMQSKALLLDRDGIVNQLVDKVRGPRNLDELSLRLGIRDLARMAHYSGFRIAVITNQPDIARGYLDFQNLNSIHSEILKFVPEIERFYVCSHDNEDNCVCRKPKPGLVLQALEDLNADPDKSFFIGDRWTDIEAGNSAKVKSVLIESSNSWDPTSTGAPRLDLIPDFTFRSLGEVHSLVIK